MHGLPTHLSQYAKNIADIESEIFAMESSNERDGSYWGRMAHLQEMRLSLLGDAKSVIQSYIADSRKTTRHAYDKAGLPK